MPANNGTVHAQTSNVTAPDYSQLKVLPYLAKPGQVHVRISNLQDHFDDSTNLATFDLYQYASQFADSAKLNITETTLSGNPKHQMTHWRAAEAAKPVVLAQSNSTVDQIAMAEGERKYMVALRPMDIRAFDITY